MKRERGWRREGDVNNGDRVGITALAEERRGGGGLSTGFARASFILSWVFVEAARGSCRGSSCHLERAAQQLEGVTYELAFHYGEKRTLHAGGQGK